MAMPVFDPEKIIGTRLTGMDKQELCEFVSALCRKVILEVGIKGRRGGIYPENISVSENGSICLGPVGEKPLEGQEKEFSAPELYWDGQLSAASDVYSVGMLMYYAFSGAKLPLEGECEDAYLGRMNGGDFAAPPEAGRRIGEIIEKCIRFKASERYHSLEELRAVLDSCIKNLYLSGDPNAEAIFKKSDDLSEVGRMMLGIPEKQDEEQGTSAEAEKPASNADQPNNERREVITQEQSDMLSRRFELQGSPAAPKFGDNAQPELEPVSPLRRELKTPAVQYATRNIERERKIAEEVKKRRRRPLAVILVLCAVLVMVAIVMNAMLKDFQEARNIPDNQIEAFGVDPYASTMPPVTPENSSGLPVSEPVVLTPEPTVEPTPVPVEHRYEVVKADVSWTQAQQAAIAKGGCLVVINDAEEFNKVIYEAELAGITRVWIGCHRVNGVETWEKDNGGYAIPWAKGEPTYVDVNDQVSEDYVMLWNNNGWACNDNRDDPCKDYPAFYSGTMGYVIEYGA